MKKQVDISLKYSLTFYPDDLGLKEDVSRTALVNYASIEVDKIIDKICEATDMMADEIEIEVCEMN